MYFLDSFFTYGYYIHTLDSEEKEHCKWAGIKSTSSKWLTSLFKFQNPAISNPGTI